MSRWLAFAALLLAVPAAVHASAPADRAEIGFDQHLGAQVPLVLEFREEHGASVRLGDYFRGRPVVLILAYYRCPMLCNEVLNGVVDALKDRAFNPRLGDDFQIVTVSFDAREHSPEMMRLVAQKQRAYAGAAEGVGHPHAREGWHFLTGDQAAIDALTQAVGFRYKYDPQDDAFSHPAGVMVLTPEGKLSSYFFNIRYMPPPGQATFSGQSTPRDLNLGLVEASHNEIGSLADQARLMLCHYDPETGTYTVQVMALVRLAGALTVLLLGAALGVAFYRERRKARRSASLTS